MTDTPAKDGQQPPPLDPKATPSLWEMIFGKSQPSGATQQSSTGLGSFIGPLFYMALVAGAAYLLFGDKIKGFVSNLMGSEAKAAEPDPALVKLTETEKTAYARIQEIVAAGIGEKPQNPELQKAMRGLLEHLQQDNEQYVAGNDTTRALLGDIRTNLPDTATAQKEQLERELTAK